MLKQNNPNSDIAKWNLKAWKHQNLRVILRRNLLTFVGNILH